MADSWNFFQATLNPGRALASRPCLILRTLRDVSTFGTQVFVARLAGTQVFDPIGDQVGRVRDVVIVMRPGRLPRAVGLVVEVPGKRRIFLPLTRVTSIAQGQVISTGLLNMRRFEQRAPEHLAVGELLDRTVEFKDGSGFATIEDLAIEHQRTGDWDITKVFVRRREEKQTGLRLRRRGATLVVNTLDLHDLDRHSSNEGASSMLAAYADLKSTDLASALHELEPARRVAVAHELSNERLADVLEELPQLDQVAILSALENDRAADVLEAMQPDDAADLLHDLPPLQAAELLALMEPEEARDVRRLLSYDENTAGGMMTTEPVILAPETSVAQALANIRRADLSPALASMVFVVRSPLETPTGRFLGAVHFQQLLREPPHEPVGSFVDQSLDYVTTGTPLGDVARTLAAYNLLVIPVLDSERRLLGAVTVDDTLDHMLPANWRENSSPSPHSQEG